MSWFGLRLSITRYNMFAKIKKLQHVFVCSSFLSSIPLPSSDGKEKKGSIGDVDIAVASISTSQQSRTGR